MPLTVGTAGHIDHGKTWLVRALTGKDTDRLPEERARGISIDLGYAPLELPDGRRLSLVDVPGHERFVRNMVAGATGIDLFLLVIDAAEGARPQTLEHLQIVRLLGISNGVAAVTKADTVDEETLELAILEARELVPEAEVVAVSAATGQGLDELRAALARAADGLEHRPSPGGTRLHVDRVFSLRGIGTVVTGTLWAGSVGEGDELRVEPRGLDVRVRSVQVHDAPVERAEAGQRVAVSLPGIERGDLARGDVLVEPGFYPVTYRLDVRLAPLAEIPAAVTVHLGTAETPARVARRGDHAQLRLERPLLAARGDRVVLRTDTTVGGGLVLDPSPPRGLDPERLRLLEHGDPEAIVAAVVHAPVTGLALQARGLLAPAELAQGLAAVEHAGGVHFSRAWLEEMRARAHARLVARAEASPLDPGVPLAELLPAEPWAPAVAGLLGIERRGGKAYLPGAAATLGDRAQAAERLEAELAAGDAVRVEDRELAAYLEQAGRLRRVGDGLAVSTALYDRGVETVRAQAPLTLAAFRDAMGVSRRTAQLLLERYDADGLTRRVGEQRVLRRAGRAL
ncbi:MAG TPA: selenocysteine-specific translation elongation factor [Gaiellaceae bacterium]|nr:selenocysteine-specific translation elongation factor [Gaiellaceae bacterium]